MFGILVIEILEREESDINKGYNRHYAVAIVRVRFIWDHTSTSPMQCKHATSASH